MSISKRRSQGGDSKYGFSPPHMSEDTSAGSSNLHLNYPHHHHQTSSPAGYPGPRNLNGSGAMPRSPLAHSPPLQGPPELPPRIDRTNKPPRATLSRTAAERLFGKGGDGDSDGTSAMREALDPPNYINATPHHRVGSGSGGGGGSSSLERHNMKTVSEQIN